MLFNIIHITLLIGAFGLYGGLLLLDDKLPEDHVKNKRIEIYWHFVGALVFGIFAYTFYRFLGWRYVPLCFALAWLLFGGIVHVVGLRLDFFYVGTTAVTDRMQRWLASLLRLSSTTLSAFLKISFLILSIYYLYAEL